MIYITLIITILVLSVVGFVIHASTNSLYVFGMIYMIKRDNGKLTDPIIARGFMNGINPPWYKGRGFQIRIGKRVLQIGICRATDNKNDDEGILGAVGGRYMEESVDQIRNW